MISALEKLNKKIEESILIQGAILAVCAAAFIVSPFTANFAISGSMALAFLSSAVQLVNTIEKRIESKSADPTPPKSSVKEPQPYKEKDCPFKLIPNETPELTKQSSRQR